ncbi:13813_t:CDS:1, partial [Dentiscutata erythropus]
SLIEGELLSFKIKYLVEDKLLSLIKSLVEDESSRSEDEFGPSISSAKV